MRILPLTTIESEIKNMQKLSIESLPQSIHYESSGVIWRLSSLLLETIPFHHEHLVFCCIGTDRSTGDALGPLVGEYLSQYHSFPYKVVGTLEQPLHALNLQENLDQLQQSTQTPYIVAIDACLGDNTKVGEIILQNGPLLPGKAVKKELPPIGDISIKGIVNIGGFMEMLVLSNTRLHITYSMSQKIARALVLAAERYSLKRVHDANNNTNHHNTWQQIGNTYLS